MAFNTYATLQSSIAAWLAKDNLSSYYDDFIALGHERLAQEIRIRAIETSLNVTLTSGVATVPSDFLELKHAYIDGSPTQPLRIKDAGFVYEQYPNRSSEQKPWVIAVDGANFVFGPYPDTSYTLKGTYWFKPTVLSSGNTTNEWTNNVPDLLFWACLAETAPFLKEDERAITWEAKYKAVKDRVMKSEKHQMKNRATITYA